MYLPIYLLYMYFEIYILCHLFGNLDIFLATNNIYNKKERYSLSKSSSKKLRKCTNGSPTGWSGNSNSPPYCLGRVSALMYFFNEFLSVPWKCILFRSFSCEKKFEIVTLSFREFLPIIQ